MATSILVTKLFIPSPRTELVHRHDLIKRLNDGLDRKLTLISAPAGFGKTTLVSSWVDTLRRNIAEEDQSEKEITWLSLDERDNDQTRFLVYFIAALRTIKENIASGVLSALQSPQPPPYETTLTTLINEIAAIPGRIELVLDDYNLIEAQSVHDALIFFLENQPPNFHLVIATREDPSLQLARLRARGQLSELRANDLRFTSAEAAEFLNQIMGLNLSTEDIATLETRTEGWIAGLQLAAISMQRHNDTTKFIESFTGSHRLVLDYLIEEVLNQQPVDIQDFLLQTAILDRLSGSLCDALTGKENGQATLEMLERANLFIVPLDDQRQWYRYHHLFADLLRSRLRLNHAEKLSTLYQRAASWLEKKGNYVEAIDHFLAAGEFQHAADIIKLGENIIFRHQRSTQSYNHTSMLRWLETLPEEMMQSDPRSSILYTQSAWELGRREGPKLDTHFHYAQQAYDRLVAEGKLTAKDPEFLMLPFDIYVGRSKAAIYSGDYKLTAELAEKALELEFRDNPPTLVDAYIGLHLAYRESGHLDKAKEACHRMISVFQAEGYHFGILEGLLGLGFSYQMQGRLRRADQTFPRVIQHAKKHDLMWMRQLPITYIKWSNVCYYRNDLAQAENYLLKALELCEQYGYTYLATYAKIYLAQLRLAQGMKIAALETIQEVEMTARQSQFSGYDIEIAAYKALIEAKVGNRDNAATWLKTINLQIDERLGFWQGIQGIQAAHVMVALDQIEEAMDLLPRLEAAAKTSSSLPYLIEALVIQAVVWKKNGETEKALKVLEEALVLAAPEKYMQVFLNEGPSMARMLYESLSRGIEPDYNQRLLGAFPIDESEKVDPSKSQSPESKLVEPLSEREIEVLQLIAEGLTNQEIAARLYISLNTVKVHTRNIRGKLGVKNRTGAVVRARTLGVLPSS